MFDGDWPQSVADLKVILIHLSSFINLLTIELGSDCFPPGDLWNHLTIEGAYRNYLQLVSDKQKNFTGQTTQPSDMEVTVVFYCGVTESLAIKLSSIDKQVDSNLRFIHGQNDLDPFV